MPTPVFAHDGIIAIAALAPITARGAVALTALRIVAANYGVAAHFPPPSD